MKKFYAVNLIPPFLMDIAVTAIMLNGSTSKFLVDLSWGLILSQCFFILPLYYVITLAVYHFKYGMSIKSGVVAEVITVVLLPCIFTFIISVLLDGEFSIEDILVMEAICITASGIIMFPGTLIIALVSYIRKKKAEKREQ